MDLTKRLQFTCQLVRDAGALAQQMRSSAKGIFVDQKGPQDFVTAADLAVENMIRTRISECFPDEAILGEEGGRRGPSAGPIWIIDPIDGTTNFMRGSPDWAVSIGWSDATEMVLGVIFAPDLDLLAQGILGPEPVALMNSEPLSVSDNLDISSSLVSLGWSTRQPIERHIALINELVHCGSEYRRSGTATLGLIGVAAGWVDAYAEGRLHIWDAAAGMVIIKAAGGVIEAPAFTALLNQPEPFLALNSSNHEAAPIMRKSLALAY